MRLSRSHPSDGLMETDIPGFPRRQGKVSDVYDLGDKTVIIRTDRRSAFDAVFPNGIPGVGRILSTLSADWFAKMDGRTMPEIKHHLISTTPQTDVEALAPYANVLEERSMLARKAEVIPVECVVRAYLTKSIEQEYLEHGTVGGQKLPKGLKVGDPLPSPIFTPTTKEQAGHDKPVTFEEMGRRIGTETAGRIRKLSVTVFQAAREVAARAGVALVDTKMEWGKRTDDGTLMLVDEVLTPDCSRYCLSHADGSPDWSHPLCKQWFRDNIVTETQWDKQPPAPAIPQRIADGTFERYWEVTDRLMRGQRTAA
jgi:phosphoribosylaminoimidazole-succinocarboxamide synthase